MCAIRMWTVLPSNQITIKDTLAEIFNIMKSDSAEEKLHQDKLQKNDNEVTSFIIFAIIIAIVLFLKWAIYH